MANGTTREYHYISGPSGLIAVYIIENGNGSLYYTVTDHLGSIVQLIDQGGNVIEETNYDPWGQYRDPNNWQYDNTAGLDIIYRGYTGHEMLPEFALINMNGRMYDPILGRMLSPDNYVQDPYNPQNYNRYAYCLNNPLKYTDPSGEWLFLIPVFYTAIWTADQFGDYAFRSGQSYWSGFWKGFLVGGISSLASAGIAYTGVSIGISGIIPGAIYGGVTGSLTAGLTGSITSEILGGDSHESFKNGLIWGGITGILSGAWSGYNVAKQNNGNVWTGSEELDKWDGELNIHEQPIGSDDCLEYSYEANEERFGKRRTSGWVEKEYGPYNGVIKDDEVRKWGHQYEIAQNRRDAFNMLKEYNLGGYAQEYGHSTAINKILKLKSGWFGIEYYKMNVMDPWPGIGFRNQPIKPDNLYLIITNIN
jgi:RHS repeat-associated protein